MGTTAPNRFNTLAESYAASEVHSASPTLDRLRGLLPRLDSVCDVACGAGHTGLGFAHVASRIVAVDPAPNMLEQVRRLAGERRVAVETVEAVAEAIPLPSAVFDLVVSRLAAHHFSDIASAMAEMTRLAKPGGYVAIIDMEGDESPALDSLNQDIEVLHDPTHVRSYPVHYWRELFMENALAIEVCENRYWEIPGGLTVKRWCELGNSGAEALQAIEKRLAAGASAELAELEISRDEDGGFRIPVRTLLIYGLLRFASFFFAITSVRERSCSHISGLLKGL
jgi:SAM-dependent methyltransferase